MDLQKLADLRTEITAKQKALHEEIRGMFGEGAKGVFESHPNLVSISWTQYTPYFNDGDACSFSSYHDYPAITFKLQDEDGEDVEVEFDENSGEEDPDDYEEADAIRAAAESAADFLGNFEEDEFEALFGDHVKVTVTPDGKAVTETYRDHD
jgi:hypothetical protein